jgi:hypothetical protein
MAALWILSLKARSEQAQPFDSFWSLADTLSLSATPTLRGCALDFKPADK